MRVTYKKQFDKDFKKLPLKIREQFYERLDLFLQDKFDKTLNNHPVDKAFPGCRSINVSGDYRAIFQEDGDTVIFITIGTHSELY
jgi:addiction module RelE/StbE family toxin